MNIKHATIDPVTGEGFSVYNDIYLCDCSSYEPENARLYLAALLPGGSEVILLHPGEWVPVQYPSVMLFEPNGSRSCKVEVLVYGK